MVMVGDGVTSGTPEGGSQKALGDRNLLVLQTFLVRERQGKQNDSLITLLPTLKVWKKL